MDSPHEVLGVDPGVGEAAVDDAYRRRVKEAHPDQGGSTEEFLLVRSAYEEIKSSTDGDLVDDVATPETPDAAGDTASNGAASGGREPGEEAAWRGDARIEYLDFEAVVARGWRLSDDDLFEKAADSGLEPPAYGAISVDADGPLLQAVEDEGMAWPFACRGGACANCAVAVRDGDLSQPADHVLSERMVEQGIRLSCLAEPVSDRLQVVYNVKEMAALSDLTLPADRFEQARADD
ncbi:MAG: ferredoxin Fer [Halolamina sp.]